MVIYSMYKVKSNFNFLVDGEMEVLAGDTLLVVSTNHENGTTMLECIHEISGKMIHMHVDDVSPIKKP